MLNVLEINCIIYLPGEEWTWSEEDFVGNIGSPAELINNITTEEVLRPVVGKTARMMKARMMSSKMNKPTH